MYIWPLGRFGQATLVQGPLTILEVEKYFEEIATASGVGSRKRKGSLVMGLLNQASPLEAKYVIRVLFRKHPGSYAY